MKSMKLRIATELGLLFFMATMVGGPIRVSQAQAGEKLLTLADLAGKFSARGSGFLTVCFNAGFTALQDCATAPHLVPLNATGIERFTRDKAGNFCNVNTTTFAPVSGSNSPAVVHTSIVVGTTSFDPTSGSGTGSSNIYQGGACNGAVFDSTGATLTDNNTFSFVVSDSGNRIEFIVTSFSEVTSDAPSVAGSIQGNVFSETAIRQSD